MTELFEIIKGAKARYIDEFQFQDELNDLEHFIKENPKVLGESIVVFAEQVDTGAGDRIDLLALDTTNAGTNQIVLIELKVGLAQEQVLWQVQRYARWLKNNPDSVRFLLEKKRLSADNFNPKIIIVASQIDPELLESSEDLPYEFDFIKSNRFGTKEKCYLVVEHLAPTPMPIAKVRSQGEWNWERYETELGINKEQIKIGKKLLEKIEAICGEKQWNLSPKFNKYYIPFKFGARNVVLINFVGGECDLGFKLRQPPKRLHLVDPYPDDSRGKFWGNSGEYYVGTDMPNFDIDAYIPFMEAAYRNVTKE